MQNEDIRPNASYRDAAGNIRVVKDAWPDVFPFEWRVLVSYADANGHHLTTLHAFSLWAFAEVADDSGDLWRVGDGLLTAPVKALY